MITAGYEDGIAANALRSDPVFKMARLWLPAHRGLRRRGPVRYAVLRPARRPEGREIAAHLCRLIREIRSQADHKVAPITLIRNQSGDPRRRVTNGIGMWTVIVSSSAEAVVRSTPPPSCLPALPEENLNSVHPHFDPLDLGKPEGRPGCVSADPTYVELTLSPAPFPERPVQPDPRHRRLFYCPVSSLVKRTRSTSRASIRPCLRTTVSCCASAGPIGMTRHPPALSCSTRSVGTCLGCGGNQDLVKWCMLRPSAGAVTHADRHVRKTELLKPNSAAEANSTTISTLQTRRASRASTAA